MLNVGDVLYNWRYGQLKVKQVENGYFTAERTQSDGIRQSKEGIDDANGFGDLFKDNSPRFQLRSLGHWVHDNADDAICSNNNEQPMTENQKNFVVRFPLDGNLFHKSYYSIIQAQKEAGTKIKVLIGKIKNIESSHKKLKTDYKTVIDKMIRLDFNAYLDAEIEKYPSDEELRKTYTNDKEYSEKMNENIARLRVLNQFRGSSPKSADLKRLEAELKEKNKDEFTNADAENKFNAIIEMMFELIGPELKKYEEEWKALKSELDTLQSADKIIKDIGSISIYSVDKKLWSQVDQLLDKLMESEKKDTQKQLAELEQKVGKYKVLADENYVKPTLF